MDLASRRFTWLYAKSQLKLKYRYTSLGFLWNLLEPALYLAVLSFVFSVVNRMSMGDYAVFLFSGLVPWRYFEKVVTTCMDSIVQGDWLLKKLPVSPFALPLDPLGGRQRGVRLLVPGHLAAVDLPQEGLDPALPDPAPGRGALVALRAGSGVDLRHAVHLLPGHSAHRPDGSDVCLLLGADPVPAPAVPGRLAAGLAPGVASAHVFRGVVPESDLCWSAGPAALDWAVVAGLRRAQPSSWAGRAVTPGLARASTSSCDGDGHGTIQTRSASTT